MSWPIKNKVYLRFEQIMEDYIEWLDKIIGPMPIQLLTQVNLTSFIHNKNSFPENLQMTFNAVYVDEKIEGIQITFQGEGAQFAAWSISSKADKLDEYKNESVKILLTPKDFEKLFGGGEFGLCVFETLVEDLNRSEEKIELSKKETHISCELEKYSEKINIPKPSPLSKVVPYLLICGGATMGAGSYIGSIAVVSFAVLGFAIPHFLPFVFGGLAILSLAMMAYGMYLNSHQAKGIKVEEISNKSTLTTFKKNKSNDAEFKANQSKKNDNTVFTQAPLKKFG